MRVFTPDACEPDDPRAGYTCVLCGGCRFEPLHRWQVGDAWNPASIPIAVWKCECELVFLYPVPTPDQLPEQGDWWSTQRKRPKRRRAWKALRQCVRRWILGSSQSRLISATRRAVPEGRLLDVGCGTGSLLNLARPYYDCVGLEPSRRAAEVVRSSGIPVQEAMIEDARFAPDSFDVVTMDAVIEHLRDPVEVLRDLHPLVRPGGVIVLKTPKFGGPAYRMHRAAWNGFRHGYHTFLFTGETLSRTLEAAGFTPLAHPRRDRWFDDILILWGRKNEHWRRSTVPYATTATRRAA